MEQWNEYQRLMGRSEDCTKLAVKYKNRNDKNLASFYQNAAEGFRAKARNLEGNAN